jgi:hypothetical protein
VLAKVRDVPASPEDDLPRTQPSTTPSRKRRLTRR